MGESDWKRWCLYGFGCWLSLTSGIGFTNLLIVHMHKENHLKGVLWELCDAPSDFSHHLCKTRDDFYANLLTGLAGASSLGTVVFGLMLDSNKPLCGPKVITVAGLAMTASGNYLIASIDPENDMHEKRLHMVVAACLLTIGGAGPYLSFLPNLNFFPEYNKITLIAFSVVFGIISSNSGLFAFWLMERIQVPVDARRRSIYSFFALISLFNCLVAWLIYPTSPVKVGDRYERLIDFALWRKKKEKETLLTGKDKVPEAALIGGGNQEPAVAGNLHGQSIWRQICSRQYCFVCFFVLFFTVNSTMYTSNLYAIIIHRARWMLTFTQLAKHSTIVFLPLAWLSWRAFGYSGGIVFTVICNTGIFVPLLFPPTKAAGVVSYSFKTFRAAIDEIFMICFFTEQFGFDNWGKIMASFSITIGLSLMGLGFAVNSWVDHSGFLSAYIVWLIGALLFLPLATPRGRKFLTGSTKESAEESQALSPRASQRSLRKARSHSFPVLTVSGDTDGRAIKCLTVEV